MNESKTICKVAENIFLSINDMPIALEKKLQLSYSSVRRQNTLTPSSESVQQSDFSDTTCNSTYVHIC